MFGEQWANLGLEEGEIGGGRGGMQQTRNNHRPENHRRGAETQRKNSKG
jgi:hypothetical protein